jgi:prophage maintenance system killer protein
MTRLLPLIGAMSFGLTFLFFNGPEVAQAQTPRTDTIRLMAATRGTNFDGTGLKWCVSQTWPGKVF